MEGERLKGLPLWGISLAAEDLTTMALVADARHPSATLAHSCATLVEAAELVAADAPHQPR